MMKRSFYVLLVVVFSLGFMATHAVASNTFSDDFTGGPSLNWSNTTAATFTNDNALFDGVSTREHFYTVDVDFASSDFVATVDLTNGDGPWGSIFFGLGEGTTPGQTDPAWGEPVDGSYAYMRYNGGTFGTLMNVNADTLAIDISATEENLATGTTIRAELSWVASTSTATFSVDTDLNGTFDAVYSVTNANLSVPGTTTRLFLGGSDNAIADNFSVVVAVPEPSMFVLLVAGLAGLSAVMWRKRK